MKGIIRIQRVALVLAALAALSIAFGYRTGFVGAQVVNEDVRESAKNADQEFPVPFEPLPKTITPCRACHGPEKDFKINWTREEILRVHTNIQLKHGGKKVWCLDCHHPKDRNYLLPLSDGKLITFERSYELCGKCHGTKYRDWRHGIHGKRTGHWNGKKTYYLCTQCHNPHSPRYKSLVPMPPPKKPRTPREAKSSH
jgi:hypothetical protein